jgi:hypothetical protein
LQKLIFKLKKVDFIATSWVVKHYMKWYMFLLSRVKGKLVRLAVGLGCLYPDLKCTNMDSRFKMEFAKKRQVPGVQA